MVAITLAVTLLDLAAISPRHDAARAATTKPAPVSERPDQVSALLAARLQGSRVEITGDRTETSTTWANPDGTLTAEATTNPSRVQTADGSWVPVDYSLTQTAKGWAPKASDAQVLFSTGGSGPAALLSRGARKLGLSWTNDLPAPTISGSSATYRLDASTSLVLTATPAGFEESVVLSKAPATAYALKLPLALTGLTAVENSGGVDFADPAGKKVFTSPAPVMHDAQVDEAGDPSNVVALTTDVQGTADAQSLNLTAAKAFLTDPSTVYPVTIDPTIGSVGQLSDTYVKEGDSTSHGGDHNLGVGNTGTNAMRTLIQFASDSRLTGADVTSATLNLYNYISYTCTAQPVYAYPVTSAWTYSATWATQPTVNTTSTYSGTASFSHGDEPGCANAFGNIDVTKMAAAWASGTLANHGIEVRAPEATTDAIKRKYFCALNLDTGGTSSCTTTAYQPTLSVTYNSIPGTPTKLSASPMVLGTTGETYSLSLTPKVTAAVPNADGAPEALNFHLIHNDTDYPSEVAPMNWTGTVPNVTPGATASAVSPTLAAGGHYEWQVRGSVTNSLRTDYGPWSAWQKFANNTGLPGAPSVSCPSYPANTWTTKATGAISCTLDTTASDGAGYYWSLDDPDPSTQVIDSTNSGAAKTVSLTPTAGQHTLYALAYDRAYNKSAAVTAYTFGVGLGGLLTPADQSRTQFAVALTSQSTSGFNQVTYQYAQGAGGGLTYTTIPTSDVTPPGSGTPISSWPQSGSTSGSNENFTELDWNMASTIHAAGGGDGPVQVQACFALSGGTQTCSNIATVTLASTSFADSAATSDLGPGTVSLNTGDFQIDATDASQASLSVGRDATNLSPAGANSGPTGIFGAGWKASLPGPNAGAGSYALVDNSAKGYVTLTGSDGTSLIYLLTSGTGTSAKYVGTGDANDGSLLQCTAITSGACTSWKLTDADGTVTTWAKTGFIWTVASIVQPGDSASTTTSFHYTSAGLPDLIVAAHDSGVTCSTTTISGQNAGCQALSLTYATTTTATGTGSSQWGDYINLVSGVSYTAYNPATSAMATVQIAAYAYDSTGHLRAAWDPRLSTPLKTTYAYDSNGRITTLTPPGRAAWTMDYDDTGRLVDVTRTDPTNGTATQAVAYALPVTGSGAPIDMFDSSTGTTSWGQTTDLPYAGAGVFPASHVPGSTNSHGDYAPTSTDWPYADLTYTDVNGRTVNSASYGAGAWQIDSTRYDANGNTVWQLDALGRANALNPTADTDPFVAALGSSVDRANLLATTSTYSSDGVDLLSTEGPTHQVQLASGLVASARTQTVNTYDQGAPTGLCPCHLVTTAATSPDVQDGTATTTADTKYVDTGYDPIDGASSTGNTSGWILKAPAVQTTIMGTGSGTSSADIVTKTRYDSAGRTVESRMPASSGTDAGTTLTTYYTASGSGTCGGLPQWAGLACQTAPAAPPAGTTIPSTVLTYDLYGAVKTSVETSGTTTRTTTNTYDAADRPTVSSIAVSPAGDGGTAVPDLTTSYDPSTGDATSVTDGTNTVSTGFNSLGEQTSYTDADSNATSTTYDIDGNVHTINDGKGTSTYTYDGTDANGKVEHRGLVTSLDTGMGTGISTFTGGYDAGGNLMLQTYPNGLSATTRYDDTGDARSLTYAKAGTTWMSFSSAEDTYGQTVSTSSAQSEQDNSFDNAGRLTQVADTNLGQCTTRSYVFGMDSTRTSLTTAGPAADGTCQTSTSTTVSNTFDTADRITNTGYSYDKFGRTLTVPASDLDNGATGGALTVGYFADDMVASQTQGANTKTFTLDPGRRLRQATDTTSGTETRRIVNHYSSSGDSPSWINTSTDAGTTWSWERNVVGLDGNLAALQDPTGIPELQLTNLHGDIVATVSDSSSAAGTDSYFESTEYGASRDTNAVATQRYGWLGGKQRSTDDLAGLTLMGARLYNGDEGRFLQVDPVPGGSANDYDYANQDPIDNSDLDGRWCLSCHLGGVSNWAAGFGDTVTFGGTRQIRRLINYKLNGSMDDMVNHHSTEYRWGGHGGFVASFFDVGAGVGEGLERLGLRRGGEILTGANKRRIAPLGHMNPKNWREFLPHYHRRFPGDGGGIGRHRPWDRPGGQSWWSRF